MFRRLPLCLILACAAMAHAEVTDTTPGIEAAGQSMTKGDFEALLADDPRMKRAKTEPAAMKALGQSMGRAFAMEAEARRRKLDQSPAVQLRIRNYTTQLLANQLLESLRRDFLKDEKALQALFDQQAEFWAQPRVRQVFVRMKGSEVALRPGRKDLTREQALAKAKALAAKLAGGADFAALAKAESDDLGTLAKGGDMGFVGRGSTDAAFETAAYSLPLNKVSEVIESRYGFHVIRVEERRPMSFASAKPVLANDLAHKEMDRIIQDGFKINPEYFGQ